MRSFLILASALALLPFLFAAAAPAAEVTIGGLTVGAIINAIGIGIVTDINAIITLDSLTTNVISVNFDAKNPLPFELSIDRVVSSAGLNGTVYATFDHTFSTPFVIPILGTKNSGTFGNVQLTQGIDASLAIIPEAKLDLSNTNVFVRAASIGGKLGFPLEIDGLKQTDVPTTYNLDLS
ncbi:hypothetical protein H0H87_000942 [Tephrocybe sp. NHM501043]|nr:hypothetical protein H0H87_000942 [Tephrocybe sp. NHM501043]